MITAPAESDSATGHEALREPFAEEEACEERDEDRADRHEHRSRAGVDQPLRLIEDHVVAREPRHPGRHDEG